MIYGVGTDVVELERFYPFNLQLAKKILHDSELQYLQEYTIDKKRIEYLAGRFAAKEAYVKALGEGFRSIQFKDIAVMNNDKGQPYILHQFEEDLKIHVSISHSNQVAIAMVVVEKELK